MGNITSRNRPGRVRPVLSWHRPMQFTRSLRRNRMSMRQSAERSENENPNEDLHNEEDNLELDEQLEEMPLSNLSDLSQESDSSALPSVPDQNGPAVHAPMAIATDNEEPEDSEPDLASILAFLLRSGQVRLVRESGSGSISVNIRSNHVGFNDSDDNGDDFDFGERRWRPPSPQAEPNPDTSKLAESRFQFGIEITGGNCLAGNKNITQRLSKRETCTLGGMKRSRTKFTLGDKAACCERYLPNTMDTVERFRQKIFCGTYSQDGSVFLSACQDQHIRLYDTSAGQFKLFKDIVARDVGWSIVDTAYSPDQRYLIYSSWSEYIHLCNIYGDYDTHVALNLRPDVSRFCAFSICFSQDNKELLAGGNDKCIYIYDRESDDRILRIDGHDDDVNSVAFADSSSDILFSGSDDGICKVWDRRTLNEDDPKAVGILAGHSDGVTHIDSKGDGRYLLSNSKDQTIKLWDMRKFSSKDTVKECRRVVAGQNWDYRWENLPRRSRRLKTISGDPSLMTYRGHSVLHTLLRARFSPPANTGQKYIYAGSATGSVVIYDLLTGNIVTKLRGHKQCARDVSWHPFESTIMSSSWDYTIGRWRYSRLGCDDFIPDDKVPECPPENPKRRRGRWHFS